MEIIRLLLIPLATWRMYRIFSTDTGPHEIFRKLRVKLGVKYAKKEDGSVDWEHWSTPDGSLAEGITCCWCASMWWGALLTLLGLFAPAWIFFLVAVSLNASALCLFFENKVYSNANSRQ